VNDDDDDDDGLARTIHASISTPTTAVINHIIFETYSLCLFCFFGFGFGFGQQVMMRKQGGRERDLRSTNNVCDLSRIDVCRCVCEI
jgi:hypothetical protein